MPKIKIKNIGGVSRQIKETFEEVRTNREILLKVAKEVVDYVQKRTRTKYSLALKKNLPNLSDKTIENRKRLAKHNQTSEFYSPSRSNLTFTGQLIDSIKILEIIAQKGQVEIGPEGKRTPYKTKSGKPVKKTPSNEDLYQFLVERGFPIFGKDGRLEQKALMIVKQEMRRIIARKLKGK